jgi:hypothetical protein
MCGDALMGRTARRRRRSVALLLVTVALLSASCSDGDATPRTTLATTVDDTTATRTATTDRDLVDAPTTATAASNSTTSPASTTTTTTLGPPVTAPSGPPADVTRSIPAAAPVATPPAATPPWWAATARVIGGDVRTDIGCASGTGAGALDQFFAARSGPLMGADYQHVVALGGNRYAWFFQDAFIDPPGMAFTLTASHFVHNVALVQTGRCFTMQHRGTASNPRSFEPGVGEDPQSVWFWPMGGQTFNGRLTMFWVRMVRDGYDPPPGDGLGWHPQSVWIATYDAGSLARLSFAPAPNAGVNPIYGYAVESDDEYTYLFGNTFEQNLAREGGFFAGQHSATAMYLARVPRGRLDRAPEYRTADGWSAAPGDARPFAREHWAENPMQPRRMNGQWVSATKVDGYWGEELEIKVARNPWGPWTTTARSRLFPRNRDPAMNTYHAHLLPWRSAGGDLMVSVSQNARLMNRDAFPHPERYRIAVFNARWAAAPPDPVPPTTTTVRPTTTTTAPPRTTTTTAPTTSTTTVPTSAATTTTTTTTSTTSTTTTSSTSTTVAPGP